MDRPSQGNSGSANNSIRKPVVEVVLPLVVVLMVVVVMDHQALLMDLV